MCINVVSSARCSSAWGRWCEKRDGCKAGRQTGRQAGRHVGRHLKGNQINQKRLDVFIACECEWTDCGNLGRYSGMQGSCYRYREYTFYMPQSRTSTPVRTHMEITSSCIMYRVSPQPLQGQDMIPTKAKLGLMVPSQAR
jgi:hypothetical protein